MAKYVHDDNNNRIEALSKEEIYALIDEVIATGELPTDAQTAFVTALKSIVDGKAYKIGFCTQAEYNQLEAQGQLVADALYIITDDETEQDLVDAIDNLENSLAPVATSGNYNDLNNKPTILKKVDGNISSYDPTDTFIGDLVAGRTNATNIMFWYPHFETDTSQNMYALKSQVIINAVAAANQTYHTKAYYINVNGVLSELPTGAQLYYTYIEEA